MTPTPTVEAESHANAKYAEACAFADTSTDLIAGLLRDAAEGHPENISLHAARMAYAFKVLNAPPIPIGGGEPTRERDVIFDVLADFRLNNMRDEDGEDLPLVDLMSNPGPATIETGHDQMRRLADEIASALPSPATGGVETGEAANHDCLAKRRPGEPMFIFLGRDPDGHNLVRLWAERRLAAGGDPGHCQLGLNTASRMEVYAADPANKPASAPPAEAYLPLASPPPTVDWAKHCGWMIRQAKDPLLTDAEKVSIIANFPTDNLPPPTGEPVAWLYEEWIAGEHWSDMKLTRKPPNHGSTRDVTPLYASPPPIAGPTKEEIIAALDAKQTEFEEARVKSSFLGEDYVPLQHNDAADVVLALFNGAGR